MFPFLVHAKAFVYAFTSTHAKTSDRLDSCDNLAGLLRKRQSEHCMSSGLAGVAN